MDVEQIRRRYEECESQLGTAPAKIKRQLQFELRRLKSAIRLHENVIPFVKELRGRKVDFQITETDGTSESSTVLESHGIDGLIRFRGTNVSCGYSNRTWFKRAGTPDCHGALLRFAKNPSRNSLVNLDVEVMKVLADDRIGAGASFAANYAIFSYFAGEPEHCTGFSILPTSELIFALKSALDCIKFAEKSFLSFAHELIDEGQDLSLRQEQFAELVRNLRNDGRLEILTMNAYDRPSFLYLRRDFLEDCCESIESWEDGARYIRRSKSPPRSEPIISVPDTIVFADASEETINDPIDIPCDVPEMEPLQPINGGRRVGISPLQICQLGLAVLAGSLMTFIYIFFFSVGPSPAEQTVPTIGPSTGAQPAHPLNEVLSEPPAIAKVRQPAPPLKRREENRRQSETRTVPIPGELY